MNAAAHALLATATEPVPPTSHSRLHDLVRRAIAASSTLTAASIADRTISDALYARIDNAADQSRRRLLECLQHDHGIDAAMAEQLGALL